MLGGQQPSPEMIADFKVRQRLFLEWLEHTQPAWDARKKPIPQIARNQWYKGPPVS